MHSSPWHSAVLLVPLLLGSNNEPDEGCEGSLQINSQLGDARLIWDDIEDDDSDTKTFPSLFCFLRRRGMPARSSFKFWEDKKIWQKRLTLPTIPRSESFWLRYWGSYSKLARCHNQFPNWCTNRLFLFKVFHYIICYILPCVDVIGLR